MFKQVMIGLFAISGVAMWWTEAKAGCTKWAYLGGSNVCVAYTTKGVKCEVKINGQDCGSEGTNCEVTCTADTSNSVAFCQSLTSPFAVRRVEGCTTPLTFAGSGSPSCTTGNDNDGDDNDEGGSGQHCTASITLTNDPACSSCCNTGETCIDVTPIDMTTEAEVVVGEGGECDSCSPSCNTCAIDEQCKIDPKKIQLNQSKPYQCKITPPIT